MRSERNFRSIIYKITSVVFLLIMMNVFFLTSYARQRVEGLFHQYLQTQHVLQGAFGPAEQQFLFSFHQSLVWVGVVCLLIGILSSYWMAKSITIPLRKLHQVVERNRSGHLGEKVAIAGRDEIGQLAGAFNELTEELAVSQTLRRRLLADIAHELNTPLTVISGNLEGMLCGLVRKEDAQIRSLYEEVQHLSSLIGDLKMLSLAEARQLELDLEPVDMNAFYLQLVQTMRPLAEEKDLSLVYDAVAVPEIFADRDRLQQIFHNLLSNAFRYTPGGGKVTLSLREIGNGMNRWLAAEVTDTGIGIAQSELPNVFERFYRTSRSRNRKSGGSGLGLAIVKELVELHGGRVLVQSREGEGCRFTVFLPVQRTNEMEL